MITLSLTEAAMLYLSLTLTILLGIWLSNHLNSRKKKLIAQDQALMICEFCQNVYLSELGKNITQCPQCHCFNKKN